MESLVKLFYEWEIQLLVVLSFILQMFLFFTGSLRRHNTKIFVRIFIWIAYLVADLVAIYALGYLSRHEDVTVVRHILRRAQPLAFFWAPFLLIHLGGQDTITAFAMEDNNLWSRHFFNLVVQVVLAVSVFWNSIGRHAIELIVSGVFVFVTGIIKYGERTWSLKCGSFKCLESSTGYQDKPWLPEVAQVEADYYSKIVRDGLCSMSDVLNIFAGRSLFSGIPSITEDNKRMFKVVELELGMMYDDLYTKALVLSTGSGITLRCISQISAVVAFALFLASDKRRYSRADIAITYSLFIGALFLDICAMFIFIMSPWTWAWLKARKYDRLAHLSWYLFCSDIGWPEKKPRWSNSMGQYNLLSWYTGSDQPARTCNQRVMTVARSLVNLLGGQKLLDIKYMMYLFVNHPEMLPLNASAVATLQQRESTLPGSTVQEVNEELNKYGIEPDKETLEEMVDLWTRLLIYAACKSRPEPHAAQLARGGELITSVWLLMAQQGLGDSVRNRIRITNASVDTDFKELYAFCVHQGRSSPES